VLAVALPVGDFSQRVAWRFNVMPQGRSIF
jgi:hypothetical protein